MEIFSNLLLGFEAALTVQHLVYCFIGVLLGTLVGVLPGIGPVPAIAMLLPATFTLPPLASMIMLAGIYYGTQYGGSTTAILINLPGESSAVVTTLDGHQMARRGRAGVALATSAIGSFFAGSVATLLLAMFAPPLAKAALSFQSPEYFSLMVLGLVCSVVLARGSLLKGIGMIVLGLLLGTIGTDVETARERFSFGLPELADGVGFVIVAMGMFGLGEVIRDLEDQRAREVVAKSISGLMPTRADFKRMIGPIVRGTAIGSLLGILPGGGAVLSAFAAYSLETQISKPPEGFGNGAIEGVAAPEAANNAGAQTSFIPMLTLGIPSNPVMALMIGALLIQGIQPGPLVIQQKPDLFWGLIASMWIGNAMLLVLNLPLVGIWARMIRVPYHMLYPAVLVFSAIGVLTISNKPVDIHFMAAFGLLGYVCAKFDCESAPLLLAFILGPMLEENFRRSLTLSQGDPMIFISRPISAALLVTGVIALITVMSPAMRKRRERAFQE